MKKLHITIALVLWGVAQTVGAQNMYRNYLSNMVQFPESSISVVHSNGNVYFFQSGKLTPWGISVSELDNTYLTPTGNDKYFSLNSEFYIKGAFEDFNGNFVLYGYQNPQYTLKNPVLIVIDQSVQTLNYYPFNQSWGEFTEGCAGYDYAGNHVYAFILNDRELCITDAINVFPSAAPIFPTSYSLDILTYYTDVSWDNTHHKFVASGSYWGGTNSWKGPFVDVIDVYSNTLSHFMYYLDNQMYYTVTEDKAMHVIIDDDHLLLYHDLCNGGNDILWFTLIKDYSNLNHSVYDSWFYTLPTQKTMALDLIYDEKNDRFNFLSNLNYCSITPYLSQGEPFFLYNGLKIGQLDGGMATTTCTTSTSPSQDILFTSLRVNKMSFNYHTKCGPVLISGIDNYSYSILTETSDISISICDKPLDATLIHPSTSIIDDNLIETANGLQSTPSSFSSNTDNVMESDVCDDSGACSYQLKDFLVKGDTNSLIPPTTTVEIFSKTFICDGFKGRIHYAFYDMVGKLIRQGETSNGITNKLPDLHGLYFLEVKDEVGNRTVNKTF